MDYEIATQDNAVFDLNLDYPVYAPDNTYFPTGQIFEFPNGDDTGLSEFNDRYLNMNEQYFLETVATNPNAVPTGTYLLVQTKILADIKNFTVIGTTIITFCAFCMFFRRMLGD